MNTHTSIYMIESINGGDKRVSPTTVRYLTERGVIELEGVDGDEEANTVTYWFKRVTGES